jgi:hypothetical protein
VVLKAVTKTFTHNFRETPKDESRLPKMTTKLDNTKSEVWGQLLWARVSRNPRVASSSMDWVGKSNPLVEV